MENDHFSNTGGSGQTPPNGGEQGPTEDPRSSESRDRKLAKLASAESKNGEIEKESKLTHSAAIEALTRQLGEARSLEVREAQERIDQITQEETISALKRKGELSPEDEEVMDVLSSRFNRNVRGLTPQEANAFLDWEEDATTEIRDEKARIIDSVISRTRRGKSDDFKERYQYDPDISDALRALNEKYILWEDGEIDTSAGFDTSPYVPGEGEGFGSRHSETAFSDFDEEADKGRAFDDFDDEARINQALVDNYMDGDSDQEELMEAMDVDPGDRYVYGPYTENDLTLVADLAWQKYVDATDFRTKGKAGKLLETSIPARSYDVATDLGNYYIGEFIAPKRRLEARDLVSAVAALGLESQDLLSAKDADGKPLKGVGELRRRLGWCSYYIARICNIHAEDYTEEEFRKRARDMDIPEDAIDEIEPIARERRERTRRLSQNRQLRHGYGKARPVTKEFFNEAMSRAEGWTEREADERNGDYNAYLVMLDDWLSRTESIYDTLIDSGEEGTTESADIPNIFGTISVDDKPQLPPTEQEQE